MRPLYRGGECRLGRAFYTYQPSVAKMYGTLCKYEPVRPLRLFRLTHTSLRSTFKYLSKNTQLLMSFVFGTGLLKRNQDVTLRRLFLKASPQRSSSGAGGTKGRRVSYSEIDALAMAGFAREYLHKFGFDGAYMPEKRTFGGNTFHSEVYVSKYGLLRREEGQSLGSGQRDKGSIAPSRQISQSMPLTELFIKYCKGTRRLLRPYRSQFVMYLTGGMAVKLYLRARGIPGAAKTSDFDFKFAVPESIRSKSRIDQLAESMRRIMTAHVAGFVRWLRRNGVTNATMEVRELKGVPLDKPGLGGGPKKKKVYRVFNYVVNGHELVDTSLVVVPGVSREHLSLKWSRRFGMPIQTLTRLWKDTLYVLAGSFTEPGIKLRNPIDGDKKNKGIKNAIRTGHLSFLKARTRKGATLIDLARRLIQNIARRNKRRGTVHATKIMQILRR